jgi:hypothetical protein
MAEPPEYTADQVRQGEIELRKPWQRWVFGAGLAGSILLLFFMTVPMH